MLYCIYQTALLKYLVLDSKRPAPDWWGTPHELLGRQHPTSSRLSRQTCRGVGVSGLLSFTFGVPETVTVNFDVNIYAPGYSLLMKCRNGVSHWVPILWPVPECTIGQLHLRSRRITAAAGHA